MSFVRTFARVGLAVLAALAMLFGGFTALPASADPTVSPSPSPSASPANTALDDAKATVTRLQEEASAVAEDLEEATLRHSDSVEQLRLLNADIAAQQAKVDDLSAQARQIALAEFQGGGVDNSVALFTDADPDAFLDRLSTTSAVDENIEATLADYQSAEADLADLKRSAEAQTTALAAEQQRLDDLKADLQVKVTEAQTELDRLNAEARAALYAASGLKVSFDLSELDGTGISDRLRQVVAYATSKAGHAQYVWGASGPNGYDCSGLMLAAYRSVGVSLPHSSRAQFGLGRAVSRDELKPGDLIFWYSPVHHVGMYIGDGKIVHARNTSVDLVIQTLASYPAPISGFRRILG
jgi:cell wall-associated NlpC family hydrolase